MAGVRTFFMAVVLGAIGVLAPTSAAPPDERIATLRQRVEADPSWAEGWQELGILLADGGRYEEARPCFERLAVLRPEEGDGPALLGMAEFRERRYDEALAHFEQARRRRFRTPGLQALLDYHAALLMILRGDFDAARKRLAGLAARGARSAQLTEAEGLAALRRRKLPEELDDKERPAVRDIGAVVVETRRMTPDNAQVKWLSLVERHTGLPGIHYAHGQFLVAVGKLPVAVSAFEAELAISPQDALPAAQIAACQLTLGAPDIALRYAEKATALDPALFAGHLLQGRALLDLDRDEEAVAALERASALAPESERVFTTLGIAYTRLGRKADAARAAAEAARLHRIEVEHMGAPAPQN